MKWIWAMTFGTVLTATGFIFGGCSDTATSEGEDTETATEDTASAPADTGSALTDSASTAGDTTSIPTDTGGLPNDSDAVIEVGEISANGTVYTEEMNTKCDQACARMQTCSTAAFSDCNEVCAQLSIMLQGDMLDAMFTCINSQDCVNIDPEACMLAGITDVSDSGVDTFANALCDKAVSCYGTLTNPKNECMAEQQSDEEIQALKILNANVINCLSGCVTNADCLELATDGDGVMEDCMSACDASFDSIAEEGSNIDIVDTETTPDTAVTGDTDDTAETTNAVDTDTI